MPALRLPVAVRALTACVLASYVFGGFAFGQGNYRGESEQTLPVGNSTREARDAAMRVIPFNQLTPAASAKIRGIVEHSAYFRRLPTQTVESDPEMLTFLIRNPEVIVNIWDVMGITRVSLARIGQYQLAGDDGSGTTCKMDLIFGNESTHIYHVMGGYKGNLWPKELQGQSIVLIHHQPIKSSGPVEQVAVTMDVFLKLENIGADLVVRTLGPLVNKSADYNFIECVAFVGQVSQVATTNPIGLQNLASRLNDIDPNTRDQFVTLSRSIAAKQSARSGVPVAIHTTPGGYSVEEALEVESQIVPSRVAPPDAILSSTGQPTMPVSTRRTTGSAETREPSIDSPTIQKLNRSKP